MPQFCSSCGAQMADGAAVCPGCGKASTTASAAPASAAGGLQDNVAGALAYLFFSAILFLIIEPYNRNKFVRFHSFQSIIVGVILFALSLPMSIIFAIPLLGLMVLFLYMMACVGLWILLVVKAYQGQKFKLPIIGDLAEKQV